MATSENLFVGSADRIFAPSEVDRLGEDLPIMAKTLAWIRDFLAKPHPDLGRPGPVCPFIPNAINLNTVWMKVIRTQNPTVAQIESIVEPYRDVFIKLEPTDAKSAINKAILLIFPDVPLQEAPLLIDGVKQKLKSSFVKEGLMLGEFHGLNPSGGLHNPDFRPLRSPAPMLAIRFMVSTDLPFLMKSTDPAKERALFLTAYLARFGSSLDDERRELANKAQAAARIEWRCAEAGYSDY